MSLAKTTASTASTSPLNWPQCRQAIALAVAVAWDDATTTGDLAAVKSIAQAAGIAAAPLVDVLFPCGMGDVAAAYHAAIDQQLVEAQKSSDTWGELRTTGKIHWLVDQRLQLMQPHTAFLKYLLRHQWLNVWHISDHAWRLAGDKSTDFNYYSKRALLSGVVSSSVLYMVQPIAPSALDINQFIGRQLARVLALPQWRSKLKQVWNQRPQWRYFRDAVVE